MNIQPRLNQTSTSVLASNTIELPANTPIIDGLPTSNLCPSPSIFIYSILANTSGLSAYNQKNSNEADYVMSSGKTAIINYTVIQVYNKTQKNVTEISSGANATTNSVINYTNQITLYGLTSTNNAPNTLGASGLQVYITPSTEMLSKNHRYHVTITLKTSQNTPPNTYYVQLGGTCFGSTFLLTIGNSPYNESTINGTAP